MSAFVVSDYHINYILTGVTLYGDADPSYYWDGERYPFTGNEDEIGQILLNENVRSVNYRYEEQTAPHEYKFIPYGWTKSQPLSQLGVYKACRCLDYQSCETDDWEDTRAFAILETIKNLVIGNLIDGQITELLWEIT